MITDKEKAVFDTIEVACAKAQTVLVEGSLRGKRVVFLCNATLDGKDWLIEPKAVLLSDEDLNHARDPHGEELRTYDADKDST